MKITLVQILLIYGLTAMVFFVIDLVWLGVAAKEFYAKHIGALLRDQVNWIAAILFYAIYIGGIQLFVLYPALQDNWGIFRTAVMGGLLGFFAYSTFDLTSLALIRGWSLTVVLVDLAWGTLLTGSTAAVVVWLIRLIFKVG